MLHTYVKDTKYTLCAKCNKQLDARGYSAHFKFCGIEKKPRKRIYPKRPQFEPERMNCKFCDHLCKNYNSRINHERLCKKNENRQSSFFISHQDKLTLIKNSSDFRYHNQYTKAEALGLPRPIISQETRDKISTNNKNRSDEHYKKMGAKVSETVSKKMLEGTWHTYADGRFNKKYIYEGILFDSSWEMKYAMWMDSMDIKWERCKKRFPYKFENKSKNYIPDFFLPDSQEYIEIKGLKTKRDESKWDQFPKDLKLTILMESDLKNMGIL
jgi:hypothetical protein